MNSIRKDLRRSKKYKQSGYETQLIKKAVIAYAQALKREKMELYFKLKTKQKSGTIYELKKQKSFDPFQIKKKFKGFSLPKTKPKLQKLLDLFQPWSFIWKNYLLKASAVLIVLLLIFFGLLGLSEQIFKDLPSVEVLSESLPKVSSSINDRHGRVLYKIYDEENRILTPLSEIPKSVIDATVAIEDQNFWHHYGFSLKGIIRALRENKQNDSIKQGGSTITQQLVKNRLLNKERTLKRKIKELILAVLVESKYSKEEILEMYLNQVPYGGAAYGIEAAAQQYFGKTTKQLSLAEATFLAGLPAAPSVYSPFGSTPELAFQRQQEVVRRMVEDGYLTAELAKETLAEQISFRKDVIEIEAPHFVMYVKKQLADQYGEALLYQGGLEITTTLDFGLQTKVEKIIKTEVESLKRLKIGNGAGLVINPQTGEILSMVGSSNYFDFEHDGQVNVPLRPRQPGSSIKPLTYSLAFQKGKKPADFILDSPISFQMAGSPSYSPRNYDGKFHGKVSLREALASSYNVPAVKLLAEIGVNNLIKHAQDMGITTWEDQSRFGLSLTLGGGEVTMLDLATAYSTFANGGQAVAPISILEIKKPDGSVLYRNECVLDKKNCETKTVLDPRIAYQITHILKDDKARAPAFGLMSTISIPKQEVAVKTGTTNNLRDNWTIGYTTDRLVATWVGNNDNTPMSYVASGITGASPIWNKIIRLTLDEKNPHRFNIPSGVVITNICNSTGTLPCVGCPSIREEVFLAGSQPTTACNSSFFAPKPTPSN